MSLPGFRISRGVALAAVFLLTVPTAIALDPARSVRDYRTEEWGVRDGLPYPSIAAITQSADGYLWIATRTGLARFDGVAFTAFTPDSVPELPDARIISFCPLADGSLWVGTAHGLVHHAQGRWSRPSFGERVDQSGIFAISETPDHGLVVSISIDRANVEAGTPNTGLFRLQGGRATEILLADGGHVPRVDQLRRMPDGTLLGAGRGLYRIEGDVAHDLSAEVGNRTFLAMAVGSDGALWLGGPLGLVCRTAEGVKTFSNADGLPSNSVRSLFFDSDRTLWVGTSNGVARYIRGRFEPLLLHGVESLSNVLSLHEDAEQNLWAGTDNGLVRIQDVKVTTFSQRDGLPVNPTLCVLEAKDGSRWVGTIGGGLCRISADGIEVFRAKEGLKEDSIGALAEGQDGAVWFAYYTRGVGRYHRGRIESFEAGGPVRSRGLAVDRAGAVWAASSDGLFRFSDGRFERMPVDAGISFPRMLHIDRQNRIWLVGARGFGVLAEGRWTVHPKSKGSEEDPFQNICSEEDGTVWLLQDGPRVTRVRDGRTDTFAFPELGPLVYGAVVAGGQLWVNFRAGVARIARADFDRAEDGRAPAYTLFTDADGMRSRAPNNTGSPGVTVMKDGTLWFCTSMGIAIIDPPRIRTNTRRPPVVIERVLIDKVAHRPDQVGEVPPGRGEFAFHFTALSFVDPGQVRFRYRLVGFDSSWVEGGTMRTAHYGGLPAGRYRFEVRACNNEGVWSPESATCDFVLLPHFYQTWWFAGCVGLLLSTSAFGAVHWRGRRLRRRARALQAHNDELERRIAERTAELRRSYDALRESQRELVEISRLAGIAEMATGVLHNLGNALNTVKVGAGLLHSRIEHSEGARLKRVVELLPTEPEQLSAFFAHDERATKLPRYLSLLNDQLETERAEALGELKHLIDSINHVAEIVAAQQAGARASGVVENVAAADLVEDACRMTLGILEPHRITVDRHYPATPSSSMWTARKCCRSWRTCCGTPPKRRSSGANRSRPSLSWSSPRRTRESISR